MKKALVLALVFTFGLGIAAFAAPLSGSWCTDIEFTITPPVAPVTVGAIAVSSFTSTLIVDYTVCGWVFESETVFGLTGWTAQSFTADGVLGAFTIGSTLIFSPSDASFTSWDSTVGVSIAGVAFDAEFLLEDDGAGWMFGASGNAGDCDFGAAVYFNSEMTAVGLALLQTPSYCFCFESVDFTISFPFACIDLVDISLGFSTAGFDGVTFSVTGIVVPGLPWLTFGVDLTFDTGDTGKVMTLTPAIDLGTFTCITLYYTWVELGAASCDTGLGLSLDSIYFYGISLEYTWNGVSFYSASSFDPLYNEDLTGYAAYWEVFTISSEADSCCGGAFDFSVSTYFECESEVDFLFDWAMTEIAVGIGLGSNFNVTLGLVVDTTGFSQMTFGFCVTW
jgi:hypothetical protein